MSGCIYGGVRLSAPKIIDTKYQNTINEIASKNMKTY